MKAAGKITTIIIAIIVSLGVIGWLETSPQSGTLTIAITSSQEISVADDVHITVQSIGLYNDDKGWSTVSYPNTTMSLATSRNQELIRLDTTSAPAGNYSRVLLSVSDVVVITDRGEFQAVLPTNDIVIPANVRIQKTGTSSLVFDIQSDNSLHAGGDESYAFLPRIRFESWYKTTNTSNQMLTSRTEIGVDQNGDSHHGFELTQADTVRVTTNNTIEIHRSRGHTGTSTANNN